MEHVNSFSRGINQDINPLNQPEGTYRDANNIRLINDVSGTSMSINNIKGNEFNKTIPNVPTIQKITITGTGVSNITINGESANITVNSGTNATDLYNFIDTDAAYTKFGIEYDVYKETSYIIIVPKYTNSTQSALYTVTMNATVGLTPNTTFIPAQANLQVIGSTTIRDDIYLFTTNCTTKNPGGHNSALSADASSVGQIWKYTYNKSTFISDELVLIYTNYLDFSTYNAISPSSCLGRYENSLIQRLYWTDNFNIPRSINVKDSDSLAISIDNISSDTKTDFSIGILQKITPTGSLEVGVYQMSYRLKDSSGKYSLFSVPSNMVFITIGDENINTGGANFVGYIGASKNVNSGKAIHWRVQDIDTDYSRIEVFIIKRELYTDPPLIYKILDEPIQSSGVLEFSYSGSEETTPATYDEFVSTNVSFLRVKTIETKDNRLFYGNVKYGGGLVGSDSGVSYDARAFRAFTSGASASDKTDDSINKYSDPARACYYKPGTSTLGGAGTNISYEFGTIAIRSDSTIVLDPIGTSPYRHTNPEYLISNIDALNVKYDDDTTTQSYPTNTINADIKYSYYSSILKGYQHEEIYRFGIQFFDKSKNPLFVEWIGDIKMPSVTDSCPAGNRIYEDGSAQTTITNFGLSFVANKTGIVDEAFVNQLYIKFSVTIPENIRKSISGYSIVRVERKQEDKSILACGLLTQIEQGGFTIPITDLFLPETQGIPAGAVARGYAVLNIDDTTSGTTGRGWKYAVTFDSPEFLLESFPGFSSGDKIKVIQRFDLSATPGVDVGGLGGEPYTIAKYYNHTADITATEYTIEEAATVNYFGQYQFTGATNSAYRFNNYTRSDNIAANNTESDGLGTKTLVIGLSAEIPFNATFACTEANFRKLIAYYKKTLSNQYGGNTYSVRSLNEYIACSHFRPIINGPSITDTFKIFGGDVFNTIHDNQKQIKNWAPATSGRLTSTTLYSKRSITFFFPCTTKHNTGLRHGDYVNRNLLTNDGNGASGHESYEYNTVYSSENNINIYVSQPFDFNEEQEFDNRIHASEIKVNGETTDSWSVFKPLNYWDVEGSYGPINSMIAFKDKVYFWQDKAFGIISINPRSLITDSGGSALQLGVGNILQRHDYLSNYIGCKHQWGITKSPYKLFWFDINSKKMYGYGEGQPITPESDVKGVFSYFINNLAYNINTIDRPVYNDPIIGVNGIRCVYDYKYNQVIYTFSDKGTTQNNFTIALDEKINGFTSFYNYTPLIYITDNINIFSTNPGKLDDIYIHDKGNFSKFYGTLYNSTVKLVSNPDQLNNKIFDNILWDSQSLSSSINQNDNTWTQTRIYNDYQNTDYQTLALNTNIKRKERTWQLFVPRNRVLYTTSNSPNIFVNISGTEKSFGERIRDKYIVIDLLYNNANNYLLSTNNIRTVFRSSSR